MSDIDLHYTDIARRGVADLSGDKTKIAFRVTGDPAATEVAVKGSKKTPTVFNPTSPATPNQKFSKLLAEGTKGFLVRARNNAKLLVSFDNSFSTFITIYPGSTYHESDLDLNSITLYLKCNKANEIIEIVQWT